VQRKILKQHIKSSPPKLPAIGPAKLMCLAGSEATAFVEVEVVDADICVAVDEAVVVNVETVELGDVRSNPASATEALHAIPPHVKNLAGPGCPALAIDILCK
jgi:hypothetical protein